MSLKIIWGDIVKEKTDALVTLASSEPKVGSGVDKFVHAAAGPELLDARLKENRAQTVGQVVCTGAFGLWETCGAKRVIHVSSVFWESGCRSETVLLDAVYLKAVAVANWQHCKTVTFPLIGSGKFGMPPEKAIDCAVGSLQECAKYFPGMCIKLMIVGLEMFAIAQGKYPRLCAARSHSAAEQAHLTQCSQLSGYSCREVFLRYYDKGEAPQNPYLRGLVSRSLLRVGDIVAILKFVWDHVKERDKQTYRDFQRKCKCVKRERRKPEMKRLLEGTHKLLRTMKDLETASQIPMRQIKNILQGKIKHPARGEILALCVAMRIPAYCVSSLLSRAGHNGLGKSGTDKLISNYMKSGAFMVADLNDELRCANMQFLVSPLPEKDKNNGNCKPTKAKCKTARRNSRIV